MLEEMRLTSINLDFLLDLITSHLTSVEEDPLLDFLCQLENEDVTLSHEEVEQAHEAIHSYNLF